MDEIACSNCGGGLDEWSICTQNGSLLCQVCGEGYFTGLADDNADLENKGELNNVAFQENKTED